MPSVYAIVPARAGSKRIPGKNIALVNGKPLIAITITNLLNANCFQSIFVSTDSESIKAVSLASGALCPFQRPNSLSEDSTPTLDVIKHALGELGHILEDDIVMCVYPTAALVPPTVFKDAIEDFSKNNLTSSFLVSLSRFSHPIERAMTMDSEFRIKFANPQFVNSRTQDLPRVFFDAGQFYTATKTVWLNAESVFENAFGMEISQDSFIDIDYPEDLTRLRSKLNPS